MKRKRLIAAFLSLMLVVTVVMPAASATGYTGLWSSVENTQTEGETPATETPAEDTGISDEGTDQTPTDPDDTDTSDEGTEQTPSDPDDTDTSDEGTEQTPTDPDDTDTSDEETATDPDDTDTSDEETPDTPAEEPTEPETPVEEPTEPDTPAEEPTEPETPVEEVPELPANELLPADPVPLAEGDLVAHFVDSNGVPIESAPSWSLSSDFYSNNWTTVDELDIPEIDGYKFMEARAGSDDGDKIYQINYDPGYWIYDGEGWQYKSSDDRWARTYTFNDLYLVYEYDDGSVTLSFDGNNYEGGTVPNSITIGPDEPRTITLPDNELTREGFTFLGWSTKQEDSITQGTTAYAPGSQFEMPEQDVTLYACWTKLGNDNTAYFYLRLDGAVPVEPASYGANNYTTGIRIEDAIQYDEDWIVDNGYISISDDGVAQNDVTAHLASLPSDKQIQDVIDYLLRDNNTNNDQYYDQYSDFSTNRDQYYILWYVQKSANSSGYLGEDNRYHQTDTDDWHIDGVILDRNRLLVGYDPNVPEGVVAQPLVPVGYQVDRDEVIDVGADIGGSFNNAEPAIEGYEFLGWQPYKYDGSQALEDTLYQAHDQFTVTQSTMFYAQWKPAGGYTLTVNKVDGLGERVDGATFTISEVGGSEKTFSAGSHTETINANTVYRIEETAAPDHYMGLEDPFYFKIATDAEGTGTNAFFCDERGTEISAPENVGLTYRNGTVTITVTNIGYFYIFHSSDCLVEEIPIMRDSGNPNWVNEEEGTYNLYNHTRDNFYYGGYYSDYSGKGTYSTPTTPLQEIIFSGNTNYVGSLTAWKLSDAYTSDGTAMTPKAGETYYLKEVPEEYFAPYMAVVYDTQTDPYDVKGLYLISATDDKNYREFGIVEDNYDRIRDYTLAFTFQYSDGTGRRETITAKTAFGVPTGYLGVWNATDNLTQNATFVYHAYVVTPDGVTVDGFKTRTINTGDMTYDPNAALAGGDGIHKLDN